MKTSFQFACLLLLSINWFGSCTRHANEKKILKQGLSKDQEAKLDQYFDKLRQDYSLPALAVIVMEAGKVYYYTKGIVSEKREPINPETPFFMGKLSEPIVATAILKLAASGRVNLDDPVVKHLPYFRMQSDDFQKINIRHLLTHTSGIPAFGLTWENADGPGDALERTTRSIVSQTPIFKEPGSRVKRSAYNYDILADIIDKVSGQSFHGYMQSEVFRPLGMTDSDSSPPEIKARPFQVRNWKTAEYEEANTYPYNPEHAGSNGFHSSARDVSKWMWMLLSAKDGKESLSVQKRTAKNLGIGLGWEVVEEAGREYFVKKSNYAGFSSNVVLIPKAKRGIALFTNISTELESTDYMKAINKWLEGGKLLPPKVSVSRALSKKLYQSKKVQTTLAYYETLKRDSSAAYFFSAEALGEFGLALLYREERYDAAIQVFKYARRQFPESAYAHIVLAEGYIAKGYIQNAKISLAKGKILAQPSLLPHVAQVEERIEIIEEKIK